MSYHLSKTICFNFLLKFGNLNVIQFITYCSKMIFRWLFFIFRDLNWQNFYITQTYQKWQILLSNNFQWPPVALDVNLTSPMLEPQTISMQKSDLAIILVQTHTNIHLWYCSIDKIMWNVISGELTPVYFA